MECTEVIAELKEGKWHDLMCLYDPSGWCMENRMRVEIGCLVRRLTGFGGGGGRWKTG